jgi:hypothetical protein
MSTVNKAIADRVAAGEFPEDNWHSIVRYENRFDGNFAYKLCRSKQHLADCFRNPNMHNPELYWSKLGGYASAFRKSES